MLIEGLAVPFNVPCLKGDIVSPDIRGDVTLRRDLKMLLEHTPSKKIGVWIDIRFTMNGIMVSGELDYRWRDYANGLSIGFIARNWEPQKEGGRIIKQLEIIEISVVKIPCFHTARFRVTRQQERRIDYAHF